MARSFLNPEFYATFPSYGKNLSFQWDELRKDLNVLNAIAKAEVLEIDSGTGRERGRLSGLELGQYDKHNEFRWFFDKNDNLLKLQRNTGTEDVPVWVTVISFNGTGGAIGKVQERGGSGTPDVFYFPHTLFVQRPDLTVEDDGNGQPILTYNSQFRVDERGTGADEDVTNVTRLRVQVGTGLQVVEESTGVARLEFTDIGALQTFYFQTPAREWVVNHGLSTSHVGWNIKDHQQRAIHPYDPLRSGRNNLLEADFSLENVAYFYFQNPQAGFVTISGGGIAEVNANITVKDGTHEVTDDVLNFNGTDFYLTRQADGSPVVNLQPGSANHDHTDLVKRDGTRSFTGVLRGNLHVDQVVVAEAFYLQPGSGGEISKSGPDLVIKAARAGQIKLRSAVIVDDFYITGKGAAITTEGDEQVIKGSLNITGAGLGAVTNEFTVNGTNRGHRLMVHTPDSGDWSIGVDAHGSGQAPGVRHYRTAGTHNNPTAITDSMVVGVSSFLGYDGTEMGFVARIRALADAAASSGSTPGRLQLETTRPGADTTTIAMTIDSDQHVTLTNGLNVANIVTAEAFYLKSGGELGTGGGSGEANTASNLGAGSGVFAQKSGVDLQFKSLVAGTNITLTPNATTITIDAAASGGSGGGFYGVIFKDGDTVLRDDTLAFHPSDFYLSQDADGKPQVNLVNSGVITASNLGAGEGIFAQKVGNDLQFKGLVAGSNITLTPSATGITIDAAAGGGSGGGFYGIIFNDGSTTLRDDTLQFHPSHFYLSQDADGKPQLNLTGPALKHVQNFTAVSEVNITHNFGHSDIVWSVYDRDKKGMLPMTAYVYINGADFYFVENTSGKIVLIG